MRSVAHLKVNPFGALNAPAPTAKDVELCRAFHATMTGPHLRLFRDHGRMTHAKDVVASAVARAQRVSQLQRSGYLRGFHPAHGWGLK